MAECAATGLLTAGPGARHSAVVHRWTAGELHRRLDQAGRGREVAGAHRAAAQYWQSHRPAGSAAGSRAGREASYHRARADALDPAGQAAPGPAVSRTRSRPPGGLTVAIAVTALLTALAAGAYAARSGGAGLGGGDPRPRRRVGRRAGQPGCRRGLRPSQVPGTAGPRRAARQSGGTGAGRHRSARLRRGAGHRGGARGTASTSGVPMAAWWYSRSPWSAAT
jgi:hypothetical protein